MLRRLLRLPRLCLVGLGCILSPLRSAPSEPEQPRIPDRIFSAAAEGVAADAGSPVTGALQKAIDRVAREGGGRLVLGPGAYVSGPLQLPGRFDLHLEKGAVLKLLPFGPDYPATDSRYVSLLAATGVGDLRLSGEGTIEGQGEAWWRAYRARELALRRPQLVLLERCERVEFSGLTFHNPPNTHLALRLCREVRLRDLVLDAPDDSPNTDGINISGKNYLITGCRISTGDDNIVILTHSARDWPPPQCENFTVRDCIFGFGHGMSIGSPTAGGIRGLLVERCTFEGTTGGIRLKSARDRGGLVEDLTYRDITMRGVKNPVYISSYYPKEPAAGPGADPALAVTNLTPRWRDVRIENLTVTESQNSLILWGLPEAPLENITLKNASFATARGAKIYHARGITLDHVTLSPAAGAPIALHEASGTGLSADTLPAE